MKKFLILVTVTSLLGLTACSRNDSDVGGTDIQREEDLSMMEGRDVLPANADIGIEDDAEAVGTDMQREQERPMTGERDVVPADSDVGIGRDADIDGSDMQREEELPLSDTRDVGTESDN